MRLQLVTGKPFHARCMLCQTSVWAGDGADILADLDGKPFKAYYHSACIEDERKHNPKLRRLHNAIVLS